VIDFTESTDSIKFPFLTLLKVLKWCRLQKVMQVYSKKCMFVQKKEYSLKSYWSTKIQDII